MSTSPKFSLLFISCLLVACATTVFKPFETKNKRFEGTGGTKTVIEGVEFWDNGAPPRAFEILGIVEDERPGGWISMGRLPSSIAKKAKEVGGDAVIVLGNNSQITGYVGNYGSSASTYGTVTSIPARRNYAKFAVIKYVD